jgi:hypothetical protein
MGKRLPNRTDIIFGFDSLLDTMTNAVGILIIVLAVAYLFVIDTIDRVAESDSIRSVNANANIQMQADLERLDTVLEQVKEEWKTAQKKAQYHRVRLDQVERNISVLKAILPQDELSRINIQKAAKALQPDRMVPQQLKDEVRQLKEQIRQAKQSIKLQRDLPRPKVTIARVPDPVPAPTGARRLTFLCRYGRLVYYPANEMIALLHKGMASATGASPTDLSLKITDFEKVVSYFDAHEIAIGGLRWRLRVLQRMDAADTTHRVLKAFLEWTAPDIGETFEEMQNDHSRYRKICDKFSDQQVYAKYYVWGDSFPEYAIAREIADANKIPAGWVAKEGDAEYLLVLSAIKTGGKRTPGGSGNISQMPVPRYIGGGGFGGGRGTSTSFAPAQGGGAVGIVGASPGGDFVD